MKHERTVCFITIIFWLILLNLLYSTSHLNATELQLQERRRQHKSQPYDQAKNSSSVAVVTNADKTTIVTKAPPDPTENPSDTPDTPPSITTTVTPTNSTSTTLTDLLTIETTPIERSKRKWAYAYLIGGCSSQTPKYMGYIYNVLLASRRLKKYGSKADIVVMIQMWGKSDETKLPDDVTQMLETAGIHIHYIPKLASYLKDVFFTLVLEKFRILTLTEYSRVLYLDGDILPNCNLDYLFDLSDPEEGTEPLLKENVLLGWKKEPSSGGFFMFQPSMEDWNLLQTIIRTREENLLQMDYPYFDESIGWGHEIQSPDFWQAPNTKGTKWTWFGAFADQGLIYHWAKYVKQSVSIIIGEDVNNWSSRDGRVRREIILDDPFTKLYSCKNTGMSSPYRDFTHYAGRPKPWERLCAKEGENIGRAKDWIKEIRAYEKEANIKINTDYLCNNTKNPFAASYPNPRHMYDNTLQKSKHNWQQYVTEDGT